MKDNRIPADLAAIAKARGLKLERKSGAFVVRDARSIRLQTRDADALRKWLTGIESAMTVKG
jgi:hypothetical protein